tara:strand:- start:1786 stop:2448 length:663 start_codon:yes stop_codon:yes gene_type:complete
MKTSVNIASLVERKEQLINTIKSLVDQVDVVNVCLNNYLDCPFEHPKVNYFYSDNVFGDGGKFLFLRDFEGYYFTCDDDIIYPPTYIEDTKKQVDIYGVVSYHGRTFLKFPIESYYKSPAVRNRCLSKWEFTEPVQIAGTGVMAMRTDKFKPPFSFLERPNMSDIWISCYAKKQDVKIWGLKHSENYFKYQEVPNTIYEDKVDNCDFETEIVNKYFNISK